jgi:glycine/D-amino acid oxidase-like deaminating enzyme
MKSIWQKTAEMPSFPRLRGEHATDVLIIGGGIVGILTAHRLRQKGIPYILVEANTLCGNTSGNTTAKLTAGHGLIYSRLLRESGLDTARAYFEANKAALAEYADMCRGIDCDYEIRDNYVYSISDKTALEKEMAVLEALPARARFCTALPLPIDTVGAVCIPDEAQFHPLKFLSAIAKDMNAYEHTLVRDVDGNKAITDTGSIRAKCIVFATHFPFIDRKGGFYGKLYQHRSYVVALKGAQDGHGMYVDECKSGLSFRNYGDLLLLGGGGHRTGKQGGGYAELARFAATHYPSAKIVARWAAQD